MSRDGRQAAKRKRRRWELAKISPLDFPNSSRRLND
jgi:hypothetical protein